MPSEAELAHRLERLRNAMAQAGRAALLVTGNTEFSQKGWIRWLTGWRLYGGNAFLVVPAAADAKPTFVLGQGAQAEWAAAACPMARTLGVVDKLPPVAAALREALAGERTLGIVGLASVLAHGDAVRLAEALPGVAFDDATPLFDDVWGVLSPSDQAEVERAQAIVGSAFETFRAALRPGRTEREVAAEAFAAAFGQGCLEGIVNVTHTPGAGTHPPTDRRFESSDVVKMFLEFLTPDGWFLELGGTFSFGPPPPAWRDRLALFAGSIDAALEAVRPGMLASDLVEVIGAAHERMGARVVGRRLWDFHGQGMHSVMRPYGLPGSRDPIRLGAMINIHPGLLTEDGLGVSATNNFLVTAQGGVPLGGFHHVWHEV